MLKKRDPNAVMTVVMAQSEDTTYNHMFSNLTHQRKARPLLVDSETGRCVDFLPSGCYKERFKIAVKHFRDMQILDVMGNLVDSEVFICSQNVRKALVLYLHWTDQVLALFTENFDFHRIWDDYVYGMLQSDLETHSVYISVTDGFLRRMDSMHSYFQLW